MTFTLRHDICVETQDALAGGYVNEGVVLWLAVGSG